MAGWWDGYHLAVASGALTAWGGSVGGQDELWGHMRVRALVGSSDPPEEKSEPQHLTSQPVLRLGLNHVSAWTSVSFPWQEDQNNNNKK